MARRKRFQRGWLLKIGKRRKVWVGRWREDVLLESGKVGRVQRSLLLGTVGLFDLRMLGFVQAIPLAALHKLIKFGVAGFVQFHVHVVTVGEEDEHRPIVGLRNITDEPGADDGVAGSTVGFGLGVTREIAGREFGNGLTAASKYPWSLRSTFAAILSGRPTSRAMRMARSGRFSGAMRPRNAR